MDYPMRLEEVVEIEHPYKSRGKDEDEDRHLTSSEDWLEHLCVTISYSQLPEEGDPRIDCIANDSAKPERPIGKVRSVEKEALAKPSSFADVDFAKLFGIVSASAATIVHPVIMIGAVVWSIGLYKSFDNVYLDDETMRKIFWFDADLSKLDEKKLITKEDLKQVDLVSTLSITGVPQAPYFIPINKKSSMNVSSVTQETASNSSDEFVEQGKQDYLVPTAFFHNLANIIESVDLKCELNDFMQCFVYNNAFCKEFQQSTGDIDISVGNFQRCSGNNSEIREIKFKTLTKSYFGPTYADAVKTTEVLTNGNAICVTNTTKMHNIPYCDKFHIKERWILELSPNKLVTLTISYDVIFVQHKRISPYLEGIISSKSSSTLQERAADFLKLAPLALREYISSQPKECIEEIVEDECNEFIGSVEVDFQGNVFLST